MQAPAFESPSLLPALIAVALSFVLSASDFDLWLADQLIALQGGHWRLAQHPVLEAGLHQLGKRVSVAAWLCALGTMLYSCVRPSPGAWRSALAYVVVATLLATTAVSLLKKVFAVDCPWDLARYGGNQAYFTLFAALGHPNLRGGCFPAGHASAGYAWVALYFAMSAIRPDARQVGLAIGLGAGLTFGLAQQLRGAHFASHDVMTFAVCWAVAWITSRVFRLDTIRSTPAVARVSA